MYEESNVFFKITENLNLFFHACAAALIRYRYGYLGKLVTLTF